MTQKAIKCSWYYRISDLILLSSYIWTGRNFGIAIFDRHFKNPGLDLDLEYTSYKLTFCSVLLFKRDLYNNHAHAYSSYIENRHSILMQYHEKFIEVKLFNGSLAIDFLEIPHKEMVPDQCVWVSSQMDKIGGNPSHKENL